MINRDWRTHSEFHTALAKCSADWVNYVICCKGCSRYLIEKGEKSLKVVAIDQGDIGFSG
jgi:hypothetical protein